MRLRLLALAVTVLVLGAAAAAPAAAPRRLVALSPFTANTLADLGVRPVGIGRTLGGNDRFSSRLRGVPRLALSHPNGPNLEQLAALNPRSCSRRRPGTAATAAMRRLGMRVGDARAAPVADVRRRDARDRRAGRPHARAAARLAARHAARRQRRAPRGSASARACCCILGVGRTPYAFLPNSWGGDIVTPRRRAAADRRDAGPAAASRGSPTRPWSRATRTSSSPCRTATRATSPARARTCANNPAWRTTRAVRTRPRVRRHGQLAAAGRARTRAASIRDVRTKFLRNG